MTGIDFLEEPIRRAKQKAAERGLKADFRVHDALDLASLGQTFDSVIDSGLFHCFGDDDRRRYVAGLSAVLKPGGRLYMMCFSNFEPGKERLMACRKAGARIYPSNEAFAQALKTGEISCGIMWKARAVQWQNAGIKVETVAPKEGVPMYVSGFVMPKNAPNKANAYAYLDAMLANSAQEAFAVDMGYNGTVTGLDIAPDLQKRIGFTAEEQKRLKDLDYAFLAKNDSAMKEWWDKVFKG